MPIVLIMLKPYSDLCRCFRNQQAAEIRFLYVTCSRFWAIIVIFALAIFDSVMEHYSFEITGSAPIYSTFFLFLMPAVTIAAIRGFFKKKEAESV
jgi:hypothetical protein